MNILHVFPGDKFFDIVSSSFYMIEGISNLYIFYSEDPNYQFKRIKSYQ